MCKVLFNIIVLYMNIFSYFLIGISFLVSGCSNEAKVENIELEDLYKECVENVLKDDLWLPRDCYDTGHELMLPLHYAFLSKNEEYISWFRGHFYRYLDYYAKNADEFNRQGYLNRIHYWYLCSWYCVLACDYGYVDDVVSELMKLVENNVLENYNTFQGNWAVLGFHSMAENFEYILNKNQPTPKFYKALTDAHFFTLAILSNVSYVKRRLNIPLEFIYTEVEMYIYKLFKSEVVWNKEGGWVLQPGVWSENSSYLYAGDESDIPQKSIVDNIGEDISHFHRMALWLRSFYQSASSVEYENYYKSLSAGLLVQLNTFCIEPPSKEIPYYRFRNYMSGHNGWYRFDADTNIGYAPWQLSRSILFGWWSFLGGFTPIYEYTLSHFPFDSIGEKVYEDPATTREQNPIFISSDYIKLLLSISAKISD